MELEKAIAETTRVSRLFQAQKVFQEGKTDETLKLFKQVFRDDKVKDPTIGYNIAFLHWQSGEVDSSEVYVTQALSVDSMNIPSAYLLARIYNATDRREEAEALIQRVNPNSEQQEMLLDEVRNEMDSLIAYGKHADALKSYARYGKLGLEIQPEDKFRIGRAQVAVGNTELGLRLLREAEKALPYQADIVYYQGIALLALDNNGEAIETFQKAISIDSQNVEARIALSRLYFLNGKTEKAWKELDNVGHMEILNQSVKNEFEALMDSVKQKL